MLKHLMEGISTADDCRKEEKEEDEQVGGEVHEVLLAVEVPPALKSHLGELLPELPECGEEDNKRKTVGVHHQKENAKKKKDRLLPRCPARPRESRQ